jgi:hypothetical protein
MSAKLFTQKRINEETALFNKVKENNTKAEATIRMWEPQLKKWKERLQVDIIQRVSDDVMMFLNEIGLSK